MGSRSISLYSPVLVLTALIASPAHAQLADSAVVDILRECRKIADGPARTACYDNIPLGEQVAGARAPAPAPPAPAPAQPSTVPPPAADAGFGANQLPRTQESRAEAENSITATVASAQERERGVYLLTLEDGAQWQFVDSVPTSYDPPRRGSQVEITSAALGSYLMRYAGQRVIRIRRIR